MEPGIKMIAGGLVLFVLGGLSVYLITSRPNADIQVTAAPSVQTTSTAAVPSTATPSTDTAASITDAESFYQAAEARREQQLADKAEADRLAKLKAIKERSVECKFWKQQQKTASAAAKIDEKIDEYCNLPSSSSAASESSSSSESSTASTASASATTVSGSSAMSAQ